MSQAPLTAEELLTEAEQVRVRDAVRAAERRTSGEIRVHLDDMIVDNVLDHAAYVFGELDMQRTRDRNGVLIYVSVAQRRAAVIGDAGINARLPHGYWNDVLNAVLDRFREGRYADGLCEGVTLLGEKLREHFPHERDDRNELSDDISYGTHR